MQIRAAHAGELPQLTEQTVAMTWGELSPRERPAASRALVVRQVDALVRGCLAQPGGAVLVVTADGLPVGHVFCHLQANPLSGRPEGMLTAIHVDPHWRRRGVARALVRGAEQHLGRLGARGVLLAAGLHNPAALQLSTDLGYWPERVVCGREL